MKSVFFTALICLAAMVAAADDRPNIILVVADDVGRDWVSCYGAAHATPNLDRLAKQGVRYETAWSTSADASSRVTLLTGQYAFRHDQIAAAAHNRDSNASSTEPVIVARLLQQAGYATAIGGRWHTSVDENLPRTIRQHGFDEYCVELDVAASASGTEGRNATEMISTNGTRSAVSSAADAISSFVIDFTRRPRKKAGSER